MFAIVNVLNIISLSMAIRLPMIENAMLIPVSSTNITTFYNRTCFECFCDSILNYSAINCFSNGTCQLFATVPIRYRIQSNSGVMLYFPNSLLPNESQCCMSNLTEVLERIRNGSRTVVNMTSSLCLSFNEHGDLLASNSIPSFIQRFNSTSMATIDQYNISVSQPFSIVEQNEVYYIGLTNNNILVVDKLNFVQLNTISSAYINGIRDIMFLHHGDVMVVASTFNNLLVFFDRFNSSTNFSFAYVQHVNYINPHGLTRVNDSFFYVTSWQRNTIYSYSAINATFWQETEIIDARPFVSTSDGNHITIDECGRFWFSMGNFGLLIFDKNHNFVGNFNESTRYIFDALITNNYVLYISDLSKKQIIRIDPHIQC